MKWSGNGTAIVQVNSIYNASLHFNVTVALPRLHWSTMAATVVRSHVLLILPLLPCLGRVEEM